jgi:Fe-S-cluster containining protein
MEKTQKKIVRCARCGTCCLKGGPVLHHEDKEILLAGYIGYEHLVTIRRGEAAYNPVSGRVERVPEEIIKVRGKGEGWSCIFYHEEGALCDVYEHRLIECGLLKCWDTREIERVVGRDTICRTDVINRNDPIVNIIETHDRECPADEVENLITAAASGKDREKALARLAGFVGKDLSVRSFALSELGLRPDYEFFVFGRPLSKLLGDRGLAVRMPEGGTGKSEDIVRKTGRSKIA